MKSEKIAVSLVLLSLSLLLAFGYHVRADDEEDENEERYEQALEFKQQTKPITETITTYKTITVTEEKDILLPDVDRDGIADEMDPHPAVAEIYIVDDVNVNGIVDTLEAQ